MDRTEFKKRMQSLKSYREQNPDKGYWDWKVEQFQDGGDNPPKMREIVQYQDNARVGAATQLPEIPIGIVGADEDLSAGPLDYVPIAGDAIELANIAHDVKEGNYEDAAIGLGLLAIPGAAASKTVRTIKKRFTAKKRAKRIYDLSKETYRMLSERNHQYAKSRVLASDSYETDPLSKITDPKSKTYIRTFLEKNPDYTRNNPERFRQAYRDQQIQDRVIDLNEPPSFKSIEEANLYNKLLVEDPDYIEFSRINDLPFNAQSTVDKWIDKQRTAIRGVYSTTPNAQFNELEPMFTLTKTRNVGGDRLVTKGGVYTSNSNEIADRFSRSLDNNPGTAAYAIVQAPDIDRTVSIQQQLAQLRRRIFPYDFYSKLELQDLEPYQLSQFGYIGKQAQYTTGKGELLPAYETSYFSNTPDTKVLSVIDYKTSSETKNIAGRWGKGAGGASVTDPFYSPRRFGSSFGDFLHEYRLYKAASKKGLTEEGRKALYEAMYKDLIEPLNKRGEELIDLQRKLKTKYNFKLGGEIPPDNSPVHVNPFTKKPLANGAITPVLDLEGAANFTPAGDVLSIRDAYIAAKNNDLLGLGLAGLGFLPFVPRIGRSKVSKVNRPPIPEVHPNYFQEQMEKAERAAAKRKQTVNDFYTQQDQTYESLIENEDAFRRAVNADVSAGTNYTGVYGDYLKNYSRGSSRYNDNLTSIRLTDDIPSEAKAQVDPRDLNWIRVNSRYADPDELDPVFQQMNPGLVRHELGHVTDEKAGLDYVNKLGDRSKFESESKLKEMFPKTHKRVQDYLLRGSEIKSHMNEFRDYLYSIGQYSSTETAKSLRQKLDKYGSNFKNLKILFDAYKNKRQFARDYNTIPLIGTSALGINYYLNQEEQRRD